MLAISTAPTLPHLLSQHESMPSLSIPPSHNSRPLNPLSPTQRPKLSLKTADLVPSFHGPVSREPGSIIENTTTPTTLNTFNNTFDLTYRPSPVSTLPSPGSHVHRKPCVNPSSPTRTSARPYHLNLPFGVRPILKNSPVPRDLSRQSISASPRATGRRVFFPAPKRVAFRARLEEEIVTKRYVTQHADLTSSESEASLSGEDERSSTSNDDKEVGEEMKSIRVDESSVRGRRKRKSSATSPSPAVDDARSRADDTRSSSARRSKRKRRRWQWTIKPEEPSHSIPVKDEQSKEGEGEPPALKDEGPVWPAAAALLAATTEKTIEPSTSNE